MIALTVESVAPVADAYFGGCIAAGLLVGCVIAFANSWRV